MEHRMAFFYTPKSLAERLADEAIMLREEAKLLPRGTVRDAAIRAASQADIAAHLDDWARGCNHRNSRLKQTSLLWVNQPLEAEKPMCETCNELDKKIEHYRKIALSLNDQLTIDRIKALVAELQAQKAALHPEQK
jgi:hypothetical protein